MNLARFSLLPSQSAALPLSSPKTKGNQPKAQPEAAKILRFGGTDPHSDVFIPCTGQALPNPDNVLPHHWARLRKLQAHAQLSARLIPNYSGRHYGALVVLADGTEGMSVNVEASRQVSLCDLRLAIGTAQNRWIEKQAGASTDAAAMPNVQTIYLVNANPQGDQPIPCADCQEWLATPLCSPDVKVISLEKSQEADAEPLIRTRTVQQMLPLYKARGNQAFTTSEPLDTLPVHYSALAEKAAGQETSLSETQIKNLLQKAQHAYQHDQLLAKDSGFATGASVLLNPSGIITEGGRMDWSTRWSEPADLTTAATAFFLARANKAFQPQAIEAVAYYGSDPNLPPIASLGRIARKHGSAQTRIITVEHDQIQVRTVKDFLPELYRAK